MRSVLERSDPFFLISRVLVVFIPDQRAAGLMEEVGPDLFSAPPSGSEVDAARVAELQRRPGSLSALT
ncbi:hypothetical protein EYF80_043289 [Liparis tanakae]|uniref:Uncharacterized protein n=1 Tax=Liparis tanakae TaxID=230148 RepID=A0A4Z2G0A1_9TELE|nr:hypothetical protein EYF80_043289 [Liparis tanakae]